jgi:predicted nucleic acid-binding protein
MRFVDAGVIICLLAGDDKVKQTNSSLLFEKVERREIEITTPATTIADVVYVLCSPRLFGIARKDVSEMIGLLLRLPKFHVESKRQLLAALDIFANVRVDFGDAMILASMTLDGTTEVYSYDRDFDKFAPVKRIEP